MTWEIFLEEKMAMLTLNTYNHLSRKKSSQHCFSRKSPIFMAPIGDDRQKWWA
jgi:hypothetical protein